MMNRRLPLFAVVLFVVACSSSRPAPETVEIDPVVDPTIIGAVDEAALQGSIEGAEAARVGRRIGRVAGVLAAVLGGPESESVDDVVERYRETRDAVEITTTAIGVTKGAVAGAKRGYAFDLQFADLQKIDGVQAVRPFPDEIELHLASAPAPETLASIASVLTRAEERAIEIESADNAFDVRESLIDLGLAADTLNARRNADVQDVMLRIHYRD